MVPFTFSMLRGMTPEACQTEEGTRLLWTMFKHITHKEQRRYGANARRSG